MSKNSVVSLTLQLKGQQASAELKRIATDQLNAVKKINTEQQKLAPIQAGQINSAKKFSDELRKQGQAFTAQKREALAVDTARKLGIRTEQQINAEIKKTHNSYAQLSILQRQGVVTAKDMERAYAAMKSRVAALNGELGKTVQTEKQIQQIQKTGGSGGMNLMQRGGVVAGAVVGAGYALQQPIKRTVDYDKDLHYAAQTFADKKEDWAPAKKWINTIVTSNAINGGVSRDDSFLAMDTLIADGSYSQGNNLDKNKAALAKAHYDASRAALASGGDMLDFANVGLTARKRGLDEKYVQAMVIQGDAEGSMRAKDLAKVINPQLGLLPADPANNARSVAQLVALNEVAMSTAGNAEDAGTNVKNLVGKLSSSDTAGRLKKDFDIDLAKRTALDKTKGKTALDTFLDVTEEIINKNPEMKRVKNNLAKATNNQERQAIWESQKGVFEQSGLAEIMPDMQSLLALVAATNNRKLMEQITQNALKKGEATLDEKANYNKEELAAVGINAADVTRKNAEYQTLQSTIGVLGDMGTKMAELTEKYPVLVTAMGGTELALKALTVAAGGASLAMLISQKKDSPLLSLPDGNKTKGAPKIKGLNPLKAAGLAGLAYTGYELFQPLDNYIYSSLDKIRGGSGERPDFVQQAIDKSIAAQSQQNSELVAKQEQANKLSQDIIGKLNSLISVTQQNKPIPFNTGNLLNDISNHAKTEEKRHGFNLLSYGQK